MQAHTTGEHTGVCSEGEEPVQQEPHRGSGTACAAVLTVTVSARHRNANGLMYFSPFPFNPCNWPVSQEEIAEIKRKMKTMNNQVTRLRDEISGKELALAKDEQERKRLDKDNETLKVLIKNVHAGISFYTLMNLYLLSGDRTGVANLSDVRTVVHV